MRTETEHEPPVITLGNTLAGVIRLYCPDCHRFAQFRRDGLLERFGREQLMPDLLGKLKPCGRDSRFGPQCQLVYWDRLTAEGRAAALAKGGLPATWL